MEDKVKGCCALIFIQGGTYVAFSWHKTGLSETELAKKILNLDFVVESEDTMAGTPSRVEDITLCYSEEDFKAYFKMYKHEAERLGRENSHLKVTELEW